MNKVRITAVRQTVYTDFYDGWMKNPMSKGSDPLCYGRKRRAAEKSSQAKRRSRALDNARHDKRRRGIFFKKAHLDTIRILAGFLSCVRILLFHHSHGR